MHGLTQTGVEKMDNLAFSADELRYKIASIGYRALGDSDQSPQKVLVNGSPKTGTTWMVNLIKSIPGYRGIGNFGSEIDKYHQVSPGDVVHGHHGCTDELLEILNANAIKVILMIRDPRDQQVSRTFHLRRDPNHAWHENMKSMSFDDALLACIEGRNSLIGARTMIELGQSWQVDSDIHIRIYYEKLLEDTHRYFSDVLDFLDINLPDYLINAIVEKNRFSRMTVGKRFWQAPRKPGESDPTSHYRKGITGDWKNHFTDAHIASFKRVAGDKLIELGYEQDLNW